MPSLGLGLGLHNRNRILRNLLPPYTINAIQYLPGKIIKEGNKWYFEDALGKVDREVKQGACYNLTGTEFINFGSSMANQDITYFDGTTEQTITLDSEGKTPNTFEGLFGQAYQKDANGKLLHYWKCDECAGNVCHDYVKEWSEEVDFILYREAQTIVLNGVTKNVVEFFTENANDKITIRRILSSKSTKTILSFSCYVNSKENPSTFFNLWNGATLLSYTENYIGSNWYNIKIVYSSSLNSQYIVERFEEAETILYIDVDSISVQELHQPIHGAISGDVTTNFHVTDNRFPTDKNRYGYLLNDITGAERTNLVDEDGNIIEDEYPVDPAVDIIDLSKYDRVKIGEWWTVTFNTVSGTETYRVINNYDDINRIPKTGINNNGKYIMADDITMPLDETTSWIKIGYGTDSTNAFQGVFNGNGFNIYNLYISSSSDVNPQEGLFGSTYGATISNLGIKTGNVEYNGTASDAITGSLIGRSMNDTFVQNCHSEINVRGKDYVGGLVGLNTSSSNIFNSYSTGSVNGGDCVGGLTGYISSSAITNSYSTGTVIGYGNYVGGLVGYSYYSSFAITNSYSTGAVSGGDYVGGLAGYISLSAITNSYYIGIKPNATITTYLSLFCGRIVSSTITNSYACEVDGFGNDVVNPLRFTNITTGVSPDSGNKLTPEMRTQSTYLNWDFDNIWGLDGSINNGYPYLLSLENKLPLTTKRAKLNALINGSSYASFNGIDNYLNIGEVLNFTDGCFIEWTGKIENRSYLGIIGNNQYYSYLRFESNSKIFGETVVNNEIISFDFDPLEYDVFYKFKITFVENTLTLYINENAVDTSVVVNNSILFGKIGQSRPNSDHYQGEMQYFKFYSPTKELIYHFSEGAGNKIYDTSGNNNHGIISGEITEFWQNDETGLVRPNNLLDGFSKDVLSGELMSFNLSDWSIGDYIFNNSIISLDIFNTTKNMISQKITKSGGKYKISLDLNISSGSVRIVFGLFNNPTSDSGFFTESGHYEFHLQALGSDYIYINAPANSSFTISNLSIKEIIEDTYIPASTVNPTQDVFGNPLTHPAGKFHNNSENYITQPLCPELLKADIHNIFFDKQLNLIKLYFENLSESVGDYFFSYSNDINKCNKIITYQYGFSTSFDYLEKVYKFIKYGEEYVIPPLTDSMIFFSKERDDTTVINKLDSSGDSDAYLTVDPAVDIIDLNKYDIEDGTGDDLGWKVVKFNTINGEKTYRVIYTAETEDGIKGLNDIPKSGANNNGKYILANDIVLPLDGVATFWTKIGYGTTADNAFLGVLNGNGFDIYNLYISSSSTVNPQEGLFGSTSRAIISNLGIKTGEIEYTASASDNRTGALIGRCMNGTLVHNCYSEIDVTGYHIIGGLVGFSYISSKITNSYSTGNVTGDGDYVGGLVGYNYSSSTANCYSTGKVTGNGNYVGGLVGINNSNSSITNSYSTGNVTGYGISVGGLVGYNYTSSSIINSYSTGIVNENKTPTQSNVSAFCGANSSSTIDSCFCIEHTNLNFSNTTVGVTNSGEKSTLELKDILTYTTAPVNWDFTTIWNIDPTETINNGYPYLRNLNGEYVSPYGTLTKIVTVNITETDANDPHSYIKMPDSIKIGGLSLFNKDDPVIYDTAVSTNAEEYVSEDPYLWHVDELNTERILSYLKDAYKFTWFVKSTFTEGTYEPLTIKEIFAYSQKIEDADDLDKIKAYIGYNWS